MPDVVISEFMDKNIALEVLDKLDVQYDPKLVDDRAALLETLAEARAIIVRNRTQVDSELLDHAPNLKVVGRLGVGLDNIDLEAVRLAVSSSVQRPGQTTSPSPSTRSPLHSFFCVAPGARVTA